MNRSAAPASKTSIPAPPRCPDRSASATAASSTTPPRATLRTIEPGLSLAIASRPISPRVARVSGTWTVTTSERASISSKSTSSTPWLAAASAVTNGSTPEDGHLHRPGADRDGLADLAEADDPERPAAQLEPGELGALPLAAAERRVGRGDPAGDPVEQGQRVLGGGDRVAGRGVDDDDPGPRRRIEVDVVDADARPAR